MSPRLIGPTDQGASAISRYLELGASLAVKQVIAACGMQTEKQSPLTGELTPTLRGGVIAADGNNPDYRYVWDRDGAIAMRSLIGAYRGTTNPARRRALLGALGDYVTFTRGHQARAMDPAPFDPKKLKVAPGFEWAEKYLRKDTTRGLGEPRTLPNGAFDPFSWNRPQTDGPALRALAMIELLRALDAEKHPSAETAAIREGALAALRVDLDYVAKVWPDMAFDLWEETPAKGHYYTREVQAAALSQAVKLAEVHPVLRDNSLVYAKAAKDITGRRGEFWNGAYIEASVGVQRDPAHPKKTELDSNVVLAAIHAGHIDSRVLATAAICEQRDRALFPINADTSVELGPGIGRYVGDDYYGGNPFYMLTLGFAELCYRVAEDVTKNGLDVDAHNLAFFESAKPGVPLAAGVSYAPASAEAVKVAAAVLAKGDAFIRRVAKHAKIETGPGGLRFRLPEQFDAKDGSPRSAPDLTWSSACFATAAMARAQAASATARFPFNHTVQSVLRDPKAARAFVDDYLDHEAPFFVAARDQRTGLAFDGVDLDPVTRELSGFRRFTATSKECQDVAVLTKALNGHPLALRLIKAPDARAFAITVLTKKIDSYERFDREYPGYGGFMPWIKIGADGSLGPAWPTWERAVPSLDNGEWMFTLLALEKVLRDQGETALADRYKRFNDKLAVNARRVFWDEKEQAVRSVTEISDIRDPNATYASRADSFIRGPHGVHEGAMILHYMSLYAQPPLTPAQVTKVWSDTAMKPVQHPSGTTWQGFWGSPHEEWEFLIMPKRDQKEWDDLFRIRQKIRTQDAVARGKPGFGASINAPDAGPQDGVPYAGDHGIPSIALEPTKDYPFYAIYGVFTLLLEQSDTPERREGVAWLLNMLRARDAVTPLGAGESVNNDGSKSAPLKTVDGSFLNWLGLMGGLSDEVRARMKADGVYDAYQAILHREYHESFGTLAEPSGFAAPRVAVPWRPPASPVRPYSASLRTETRSPS